MGREAYKTTSGLLDDFDFWIAESWFATDKRFGGGRDPILHLRGQALIDGEVVDEEETLLYGCGQGWKVANGGQAVTHTAGKTNFTDASNIGKFLDALDELGDEPLDTLGERGSPTDAEVYLGIGLHMERKEFTFKDRKTGETTTYEVALPTAFLGFADSEAPAAAPAKPSGAPKKATGAAKKATAPAKKAAPTASAPAKAPAKKKAATENDLRAAVVEYAAVYEATEHAEFVDAVYDPEYFNRVAELNQDEQLAAEILDPESELWAEAHPS